MTAPQPRMRSRYLRQKSKDELINILRDLEYNNKELRALLKKISFISMQRSNIIKIKEQDD